MKRFWLLFSQTATIALAVYFVLATLKPQWFEHRPALSSTVSVFQASPGERTTAVQASSFSPAAKRAAPAVVSITTSKAQLPQNNDPWFRFFYGDQANNHPQTGLGSGVIVSPDGYILTNNHVVEEADQIEVQLSDGRRAQAHVIGTDPETDLAILKIELGNLPAIVIGNSDELEVGDIVLAIGNPFGVGQTVTSGIVSALGRSQLGINTFENFIQTDAAINPGNSGGALVDANGSLMGINTAIYSRSGGSMGIGFAIPMSTARNVLEAIVRDGTVTRGWIGVEPQDLTPELAEYFGTDKNTGVIITGVLQNGPAAAAGVRPGDIIVSVAGRPVHEVSGLLSAVASLKPGQATEIEVIRGKNRQPLKVVPGRRTPPANASPR
ncbi:MAG TPA: trypsin-like peptidase domain-containing protein [Macromonas sp.]|nr:trypsin-like peptidase domain-containing protein [Macromonas sp.]